MVAKLVIEEGDLKGSSFILQEDRDKWVMGSDPDECQLVLKDPMISQQHALITRIPEGMLIENLSQTNPIRINDEEMSLLPRLLEEGDLIQIGKELLRYDLTDSNQETEQTDQEIENSEIEETEVVRPKQPLEELDRQEEKEAFFQESSESEEAFLEEESETPALAKINFGLIETGRWLLKVVGGPNTGAEFYMEAGQNYILGTDPNRADVIFHDTSVSRQHAKIKITNEESLFIEDLQSRNGVLIGELRIEGQHSLPINTIISLGTTSFAVYDREGEMHTIISPLLPSVLKSVQKEVLKEKEVKEHIKEPIPKPVAPAATSTTESVPPHKSPFNFSSLMILLTVLGLFTLAGFGMTTLFQTKPIEAPEKQENIDALIEEALAPFPAIHYTFNPINGNLLLVGHVLTPSEKNLLFSHLQGLNKYIKSVEDSEIVIDEYAWREVNSILADNPAWKDISIHSPKAGQFVISGHLKTRKQAEQLSNYLSLNFRYPDLLKKQIIVEEDVLHQIQQILQKHQLSEISPEITNGEVTLSGHLAESQAEEMQKALSDIKQLPGVRVINNKIQLEAPPTEENKMSNISDHYRVSGKSQIGSKYTVVINGRIVSEGDTLDGMEIKKITANHVFLENADGQYRIDY